MEADTSSNTWKQWLLKELTLPPDTNIAIIKGYGSGLQDKAYHREALLELAHFRVIAFDGDWQKEDSFTSLVQPFLAEDPSRLAVAFRKAEDKLEAFETSWSRCPQLSQMALALVPSGYMASARKELRDLGVEDKDIENTVLGWLTLRFSGSSHALAVGGGVTTVNEAKAFQQLLTQKPGAMDTTWSVLNIGRKTQAGDESPTQLVEIAEALPKLPSLKRSTTARSHLSCLAGCLPCGCG